MESSSKANEFKERSEVCRIGESVFSIGIRSSPSNDIKPGSIRSRSNSRANELE